MKRIKHIWFGVFGLSKEVAKEKGPQESGAYQQAALKENGKMFSRPRNWLSVLKIRKVIFFFVI